MKWAIIGLTSLGIVAAACAALLVSALRAGPVRNSHSGSVDADVQVLTTAHPVHEMTVVESGTVISKTMPRSMAPAGYISDPVQVVDRILLTPMAEGQVFTTSCFANDEKTVNRHLAALLPKGKRAVGITVSDYAGLEGVLYPGCAVDVMVSGKTENDGKMEPSSRLLLENISVWGIEKETIVSVADKVGADTDSPKNSSHRRITVLVDSKQAKALEKGMEEGTLSLALRNPLDTATEGVDSDNKGKGGFTKAFATMMEALRQRPVPKPAVVVAVQPATRPAPQWDLVVIRGDNRQTQSFPSNEAFKGGAAETAKAGADAQPAAEPAAQ